MTDLFSKKSDLVPTPANSSEPPLVGILLCTYNGARFLAAQLESIESQEHTNWFVVASDDGSSDHTLEILQHYQAKWPQGKLVIRSGPQKGFCQNFLSLACDPNIKADYYAFCDQDDVWLPQKLSVALMKSKLRNNSVYPYLYCGRVTYAKENLQPCGLSNLYVFPPSFRNALVQSIAGGNTMLFNSAAKKLLEKAGQLNVPSHDWWTYLIVSGADGEVFYDSVPFVLYRQHKNSLIGGRNSLASKFKRGAKMLEGRFQQFNTLNIAALLSIDELLSSNHLNILNLFKVMIVANLRGRLRLIGVCGLYRQTRRGTLSLYVAALFNKI